MERVLHHDRSAWILNSIMLATLALVPLAASADQVPMEFAFSAVGAETDPTGLFTREEVAEGGSQVQPSVWHSTTPVDGGRMTLAILVDQWCGTQECPYRFRLEANNGLVLLSHQNGDYGMICQNTDAMAVDPVALTMTACGTVIDLKTAR